MKDKFKKKSAAHIRYYTKDGVRVPGVTTIVGMLGWNTRILMNWANKLGLEGIESAKYVDEAADIGKLTHQMCVDWLKGEKPDLSDYTPNQVKAAKVAMKKFKEWSEERKLKPFLLEEPLVSEAHRYGGTLDIYGETKQGARELIDLKTGSGIYDEMVIQVAGGYYQLLREQGIKVDKVRILNIPRTKDETWQEREVSKQKCALAWKIFKACLTIYRVKKELGK